MNKSLTSLALILVPLVGFTERPNILLLIAEDLSPRIEPYGDDLAKTPNLTKLGTKSIRYTSTFTTAGVCAPSRASLITGQHQISFGAQHMRTSTSPLGKYLALPPDQVKAFPELLRREGYFTFTDSKLDYQFSGIRSGSGPFTIWDSESASDTGWRDRNENQPFFGMINFFETHESGVMRPSGIPHSATHLATQLARLKLVAPEITNPQDVKLPPYYPDNHVVRRDIARHYDNIALMDERLGAITRALKEDGLFENTIIIWTSDHGDGLPRAKRELLDSGIKVPLLIKLQCDTETKCVAKTDDRLVSFVDLAPTILSLASAPVPHWLHGQNIFDSSRTYVFASRDRIDEVEDRQRAIRSKDYKYIRSWYPGVPGGHELDYRDNLDMVRNWRKLFLEKKLTTIESKWFEPPGERQLYNVFEDPFETNNLINKKEHEHIVRDLDQQLTDFLIRVGDKSELSEDEMKETLLCNGEICQTAAPTLTWENGKAHLSSKEGASIGYQAKKSDKWSLYIAPLDLSTFRYKAVRYGFEESEVLVARAPNPAE